MKSSIMWLDAAFPQRSTTPFLSEDPEYIGRMARFEIANLPDADLKQYLDTKTPAEGFEWVPETIRRELRLRAPWWRRVLIWIADECRHVVKWLLSE